MKTYVLFASVAALAAAGVALAQPATAPAAANRDADVTRQQVIERTDQHFQQMDANNDGRFTQEEARQQHEQRRAEMRQRMFERLDGNRDGNISREEFAQAHADRDERRGERGERGMHGEGHGGPGMGMHHRRGPGGRGMGMGMGRMFGEQGFVTREQFRERALARFDRLDADSNGTVTADERRAAHDRRGRRGERDEPGE